MPGWGPHRSTFQTEKTLSLESKLMEQRLAECANRPAKDDAHERELDNDYVTKEMKHIACNYSASVSADEGVDSAMLRGKGP